MHGKSDSISLRKPFADIDITSAFEICDAMILNINQVPDQDFVLASGRTIKLNELVMRVASEIGVTKKISNLEGLMKHVEPESHPFVRSNPSKASIILGWEASSTPEEILMEMISHREKAGKN
jgi:GDP-D-mannose dehydratase